MQGFSDMARFDVPEERYYRIGEVADMLGVKTSKLRFWESEFPELKPKKTRSGQRLYTGKDVELIRKIQHELKTTGMTIKGLRKKMRGTVPDSGAKSDNRFQGELIRIRDELKEIVTLLKQDE